MLNPCTPTHPQVSRLPAEKCKQQMLPEILGAHHPLCRPSRLGEMEMSG